jgi:hypothetical protein
VQRRRRRRQTRFELNSADTLAAFMPAWTFF